MEVGQKIINFKREYNRQILRLIGKSQSLDEVVKKLESL